MVGDQVPEASGLQQLAAVILRGHGHPSLPMVAFYVVHGLQDGVALRERCLDRAESLTWTVTTPLMQEQLHVFETRAGVPVAIHYFETFNEAPDSSLNHAQCQYLDAIAILISSLHGIENKDGASVKLPWVYVVQLAGGDGGQQARGE